SPQLITPRHARSSRRASRPRRTEAGRQTRRAPETGWAKNRVFTRARWASKWDSREAAALAWRPAGATNHAEHLDVKISWHPMARGTGRATPNPVFMPDVHGVAASDHLNGRLNGHLVKGNNSSSSGAFGATPPEKETLILNTGIAGGARKFAKWDPNA